MGKHGPGRDAAVPPRAVVWSQSLVMLLPLAVFVDEALPVFDWVTVVALVFDAVAAPVVIDAVELPVFVWCAVLDALPPELPAWLPSPDQPMLPPVTPPEPLWLPRFTPMVPEMAVLPPLFAQAPCEVSTPEYWPTERYALPPFDSDASPSSASIVLSLAELLTEESPSFFWLTVVFASFLPVAAPVLTSALLVPSFDCVASFVQSPPSLPVVLSSSTPLMSPPSLPATQYWSPRLMLPVIPSAWLAPVFASASCCVKAYCDCSRYSDASPPLSRVASPPSWWPPSHSPPVAYAAVPPITVRALTPAAATAMRR